MKVCPSCGVTQQESSGFCTACGYQFSSGPSQQLDPRPYGNISVPPPVQQRPTTPTFLHVGTSNRVNIAFAALFIGFTGIHKFQTGKVALGFLYLVGTILSMPLFFRFYFEPGSSLSVELFFYAKAFALPGVISTIEAIRYFCLSDQHFKEIYGV